ncbi:hypothetical protein B0H15DRAFT_958476 [Mycena belliarum]|uniref:Uncharacterized protein n=1 Tax=Mycena belliarum TaxID=1033014 RepID=A0AAD6XDF4_9AGAR|nr:hypothetical protein B0H15DRAFT_958476 [Mycena belliae]
MEETNEIQVPPSRVDLRMQEEKADLPMRASSPPRHPRNRGGGGGPPGPRGGFQRRSSRSPPRGPRGDRDRPARGGHRGESAFSTGPNASAFSTGANTSTYPTGANASTYPSSSGASTYPAPQTPTMPMLEPHGSAQARVPKQPRAALPPPEPKVLQVPLPPLPKIPT